MSVLSELVKITASNDAWDAKWHERWVLAQPFIEQALGFYFGNNGINPFEKVNE